MTQHDRPARAPLSAAALPAGTMVGPYLTMEYVDGPSLAEFSRGRRLSVGTVPDLGAQLCAGLQAAHEQGVVHRDVKPSDVLVDSRLRAKLVDFGLAYIEDQARLTATGSLCGTLGYCPPEAVLGEEGGEQGDLFSLGVILFELLAGEPPFPAPDRLVARARQRPSIAVLPFEDMSPEHDQEYLCDGIAEELMNVLTRIKGLRVIARTSAFAFKGSRGDARKIGRSLGVGACSKAACARPATACASAPD